MCLPCVNIVDPSMLFPSPHLIVGSLFPGIHKLFIVVCHPFAVCETRTISLLRIASLFNCHEKKKKKWLIHKKTEKGSSVKDSQFL